VVIPAYNVVCSYFAADTVVHCCWMLMFVVAVEADAVVSTTSMTLAEGFARLHKEALALQVLLTQRAVEAL